MSFVVAVAVCDLAAAIAPNTVGRCPLSVHNLACEFSAFFAERDLVHMWTNLDAVRLRNELESAWCGRGTRPVSRADWPFEYVVVVMIPEVNDVAWSACRLDRRGSDWHVEQDFQDVAGLGIGAAGGGGPALGCREQERVVAGRTGLDVFVLPVDLSVSEGSSGSYTVRLSTAPGGPTTGRP